MNWVEEANVIRLHATESSVYRMMFALLSYDPFPARFGANARADAFVKCPQPIDLQLSLPTAVLPGNVEATVNLVNNTDEKQTLSLTATLPAGWAMMPPPNVVTVAAKESLVVPLTLQVPGGQMRESRFVTVTASAVGSELKDVSAKRGTVTHIPFAAEYAQQQPTLDGDISEWNPQAFVTENHQGSGVDKPFTTKLAAKWDMQALYIALDVEGRQLTPVPAGDTHWWSYDTIELFFDLWNKRRHLRDHQAVQAGLTLHDEASGGPVLRNYPKDPNGVTLPPVTPASYKLVVKQRENGFTDEACLDWASLSTNRWMTADAMFTPQAGFTFGLEASLASRSLLGARVKEYDNPSKWGKLKLLAPGETVRTAPAPILLDLSTEYSGAFAPLATFDVKHADGWMLAKNATVTDTGRDVSITFAGFGKDETAQDKKLRAHARIYLTPQKDAGNEPYTMDERMALLVEYRKNEDATLTLYAKTPPQKNWGKHLWSATVASGSFPLTVTLHVDKKTYRVSCDKTLTPQSGSLSGYHELKPENWSRGEDGVRFGIKSCFATAPGFVTISSVEIR